MKKSLSIITTLLIVAVAMFSFAGCSEMGNKNLSATAIWAGDDTVIEVTVITDSAYRPIKVHFDEILGATMGTTISDASKMNADDYLTVKAGWSEANHYKYISVGDKFFKATLNGKVFQVSQIGGGVTDLGEYITIEAGLKEYYDAFKANKLCYYVTPAAGNTKPTVEVDGKQMLKGGNLVSSYGSMRKRYSTYWQAPGLNGSTLGWMGNMDAMEMHFIANGFEGAVKKNEAGDAWVANVEPNKDGDKLTYINGHKTGATLNGGGQDYIMAANLAYQKILNSNFSYKI